MAQSQVIEGTPQEIADHLKRFSGNARLRLIIPPESEEGVAPPNLHHATPEERARALDEIAEMNRDLPALPDEACRRENLHRVLQVRPGRDRGSPGHRKIAGVQAFGSEPERLNA